MPKKRNLDDLSDVYPKTNQRLTNRILDLLNCFVEFYVAKYNGSHLSDYMKCGYNGFKPYVDQIGIKAESRLTDLVLDSDQYCRSLRLKSEDSGWIKTSGLQTKEIYFAFAVNLFGERDVEANSYFTELMEKRGKISLVIGNIEDPTIWNHGSEFRRKHSQSYEDKGIKLIDDLTLLKQDSERFRQIDDFIPTHALKKSVKEIDVSIEEQFGISAVIFGEKPFRRIPLNHALVDGAVADQLIDQLIEHACPVDKLTHYAKKVLGQKWRDELPRLVKSSKHKYPENLWAELALTTNAPEYFQLRYFRLKDNWNIHNQIDEEIVVDSKGTFNFSLRDGKKGALVLSPADIYNISISIARLRPHLLNDGHPSTTFAMDLVNERIDLRWGDTEHHWENTSDWGENGGSFYALIDLLRRIALLLD